MSKKDFKQELRLLTLEASYHKKSLAGLATILLAAAGFMAFNSATTTVEDTSATECPSGTCNTTFQVNVQDILSVSVTSPVSGATGNVGDFLRNTVDLNVTSNASNGFTASMYSGNNTVDLVHKDLGSTYKIESISSSTQRSAFPAGNWGYSLSAASLDGKTYGETSEGNANSYYYPLTTSTSTPITILSAGSGTKTGSQNIYFGAKAANNTASGTYTGTVVISVVTGTVDSNTNPVTPTNPATPETDTTANDNIATYTGANTSTGVGTSANPANGTTVYTTRTTNTSSTPNTTTTTTEVSAGDNTSSYTAPQGVSTIANTNQSNLTTESPVPIALAATAATSAAAGVLFFILAKKRDKDEEEDQ